MRGFAALFVLLLMLAQANRAQARSDIPSPDWRDQIIYFVMIDRFNDGDPSNNDQGQGEFDPRDGRRYSGGDLAGIVQRLDYIQGLGASALWITPPVAHVWWDGQRGYGGYHGYWAQDFRAVDAHFGSLDDYRALAEALHARGMYLIQDVVVNHVGNFFDYRSEPPADDLAAGYRPNPDSRPVTAPTQSPFDLNDARIQSHREAAIYHWTPEISDYGNHDQELRYQLAGLDDLNTANPRVRQALRDSYGYWIREVGVDAFRVDTAFHVPAEFFEDFLSADDPEAPGVLHVARETGREDFHVFGEGFAIDQPFEDRQARRIESYHRDDRQRRLLPGMLNFPLYGALSDVFVRGRPTAVLAHRVRSMMQVHADPHRMPTFIDNHDVDRFLAAGNERGLRQALLAMMTLPGIPVIYYGTEQGFIDRRRGMFAGSFRSEGRDAFDDQSSLYRYLAELSALRRDNPLLSRGNPTLLHEEAAGPGALVWRMGDGSDALWVIINTAEQAVLAQVTDSGLAAGSHLLPVFSAIGEPAPWCVGEQGALTLQLPPGAAWVMRADAEASCTYSRAPSPRIEQFDWHNDGQLLRVRGQAQPDQPLRLLRDGRLQGSVSTVSDQQGGFEVELPVDDLIDPEIDHHLLVFAEDSGAVSPARNFRARPQWRLRARASDPVGDDHGPEQGAYQYPLDSIWRSLRTLDILGASAWTAGSALKIAVDMRHISRGWNPPNGFDRVALTVHISVPGRSDGQQRLPLLNADMPDNRRWHYRLRAGGWSNALHSALAASHDNEGTALTPSAAIEVDASLNRVIFTIPGGLLNLPEGWSDSLIHISSWDQDGDYRALLPEATANAFGGGDGGKDPLIMDSLLLRLD